MSDFVLDEALSAAEAPDRVYRRGGRIFKVKVRAKSREEMSRNAPRFGMAAYRVTASLCDEQGKALPLDDTHCIAPGVNLTLKAHADLDVTAALETARMDALAKADAAAALHEQLANQSTATA